MSVLSAAVRKDPNEDLVEEEFTGGQFIEFTYAERDHYDEWLSDENDAESEIHPLLDSDADTSPFQYSIGKDIQGIPWDLMHFTREKYRDTRLQQYKNYKNLDAPEEETNKEATPFQSGSQFFEFRYNTRAVKSTIVHFQLRNLVWATSKHDVYVMHHHTINHWSPVTRNLTEVLNLNGVIVPTSDRSQAPGSNQQPVERVQISTMCARGNLLVVGGFHGEIICKRLDADGIAHCCQVSPDPNAITNAVEIAESPSGAVSLVSSNNDSMVRVYDGETFATRAKFEYSWPINQTSVSPDGKLLLLVGDDPDGLLADSQSGKTIATLKGHVDYSFASAWHPENRYFATGNQDKSCRVWDVRHLKTSLFCLKGRIGAIRSVRFSSDGRFMSMAEPADFVHIFDLQQGYTKSQEIDLFGELAGVAFSPDSEAFFVGVADRMYGSLLEYNRHHCYRYLDSFV